MSACFKYLLGLPISFGVGFARAKSLGIDCLGTLPAVKFKDTPLSADFTLGVSIFSGTLGVSRERFSFAGDDSISGAALQQNVSDASRYELIVSLSAAGLASSGNQNFLIAANNSFRIRFNGTTKQFEGRCFSSNSMILTDTIVADVEYKLVMSWTGVDQANNTFFRVEGGDAEITGSTNDAALQGGLRFGSNSGGSGAFLLGTVRDVKRFPSLFGSAAEYHWPLNEGADSNGVANAILEVIDGAVSLLMTSSVVSGTWATYQEPNVTNKEFTATGRDTVTDVTLVEYTGSWDTDPQIGELLFWVYDAAIGDYNFAGDAIDSKTIGMTNCAGSEENPLGVVINETPSFSGGSSAPATLGDIEFDQITGSTLLENAEITFSNTTLDDNPALVSNDTPLATIDSNKIIHDGSAGYASINASAAGFNSSIIERKYTGVVADAKDTTGYVAGTLGAHLLSAIKTITDANEPRANSDLEYISSFDDTDIDNPAVTLNGSNMFSAFDFSGISIMANNNGSDQFPLTVISARHAITANHVSKSVGDKIAFRNSDGTYQTATIGAIGQILTIDLKVIYFDSDLDISANKIAVFKVMENSWLDDYMPSMLADTGDANVAKSIIPTIRKSRHFPDGTVGSCLVVNTISGITTFGATNRAFNNTRIGELAAGEISDSWGIEAIGGDSGGSSFVLLNGEPILVTCQQSPLTAPDISDYVADINTVMNTLAGSGTWALLHPNMSGFTTY